MGEAWFAVWVLGILLVYARVIWDDLVFDLAYLLRFRKLGNQSLTPEELEADRPQRLAVLLPTWQDAQNLGPMLRATLGYTNYSPLHLDFFVGVHPNDPRTLEAAEALSQEFVNVHVVVCNQPGPLPRGQLLNFMYAYLERFERHNRLRFEAVALHSPDDVIHPYAFKLYSTLLRKYPAVQLPVCLLPAQGSFWKGWLEAGFVADSAEAQRRHLPLREQLGVFVPNASSGFALRRELLPEMASDGNVFSNRPDAPDFDPALRLWRIGLPVHQHLQFIWRMDDQGQAYREMVTVQQLLGPHSSIGRIKTSWTFGLGRRLMGLLLGRPKGEEARALLPSRHTPVLLNLAHLVGWPTFAYALLAQLFGWPGAHNPVVVGLLTLLGAILLFRWAMRVQAVRALYGPQMALKASWLPPGFPLHWILRGLTHKKSSTARPTYMGEAYLEAHRLRLGDQLLFYNDIPAPQLAQALQMQSYGIYRPRLGEILVAENFISEQTLRKRLAELRWTKMAATVAKQTQALNNPTYYPRDLHRRKQEQLTQEKNPTVLTDTMF
ncbi:MAG: glycosyltransferase [Meiothermus sp.]|uniref:glycosyltransferase n=1 Tax=Meiothermus sp. TaxID=1955249 RepID=UPI0025F343F2|nr:glycosyltransferase [Meiothermus sp.]MCS7068351.1 glycosyltransferase [Meiothermus sp.]MDW8426735.1 glycosyltransferase [Meiothermus sp.]